MKNARMPNRETKLNQDKNENSAQTLNSTQGTEQVADVLYQRLGNRWFAFSLVNDEVFFGAIDPELLEEPKPTKTKQKQKKIAGTS